MQVPALVDRVEFTYPGTCIVEKQLLTVIIAEFAGDDLGPSLSPSRVLTNETEIASRIEPIEVANAGTRVVKQYLRSAFPKWPNDDLIPPMIAKCQISGNLYRTVDNNLAVIEKAVLYGREDAGSSRIPAI